jgi:ethanolamine utilization protein EutN
LIIAKVVGNVWATKKDESLNGLKFFVVQPVKGGPSDAFVAVDSAGAGIGDHVLISQGSSARMVFHGHNGGVPVDAVIVGIIDSVEVDESLLGQ